MQSMGSVGDAYDNAMCESFFATLECELLDRSRFPTPADARRQVFGFIEGVVVPVFWTRGRPKHQAAQRLSFSRTRAGSDTRAAGEATRGCRVR